MAKVLVHIHSGPEAPNKVTLGALVAATAATDGHDVTVFFAGDGAKEDDAYVLDVVS